MHYLLYFPGHTGITNEHLARAGLADLARDRAPEWFEPAGRGPDGGRGVYCTWRNGDAATDPPLDFHDGQQWQPVEGASYWIGFDRERPPRPEDLERKAPIAGYGVTLLDNRTWCVPSVSCLGQVARLKGGRWITEVKPELAAFAERCGQYAGPIFAAADQLDLLQRLAPGKAPAEIKTDFTFDETVAFAVEALALNYRLNAAVADRLAIFDEENLGLIVKAAIDLPKIIEVGTQKKSGARLSIPVG